jgi:hypothetical protein
MGAGSWLGEYKNNPFFSLVEKERQTWLGWELAPGWVSTTVILLLIGGEEEANVAWMGAGSWLGEYKCNPSSHWCRRRGKGAGSWLGEYKSYCFSLVEKERQTLPGWVVVEDGSWCTVSDWFCTRLTLLLIGREEKAI